MSAEVKRVVVRITSNKFLFRVQGQAARGQFYTLNSGVAERVQKDKNANRANITAALTNLGLAVGPETQ